MNLKSKHSSQNILRTINSYRQLFAFRYSDCRGLGWSLPSLPWLQQGDLLRTSAGQTTSARCFHYCHQAFPVKCMDASMISTTQSSITDYEGFELAKNELNEQHRTTSIFPKHHCFGQIAPCSPLWDPLHSRWFFEPKGCSLLPMKVRKNAKIK